MEENQQLVALTRCDAGEIFLLHYATQAHAQAEKDARRWRVAALKVPPEYALLSASFYGEVVGAQFHNEECLVLMLRRENGARTRALALLSFRVRLNSCPSCLSALLAQMFW